MPRPTNRGLLFAYQADGDRFGGDQLRARARISKTEELINLVMANKRRIRYDAVSWIADQTTENLGRNPNWPSCGEASRY